MRKVSIKGVLAGGIVDVVTSVVLGLPFAIYAMSRVDLRQTPAQTSAAVTAFIHGNAFLYGGELLVGVACSVLGGYVAARLAKHDELLNGGLSAFLCVAIGIFTIAMGKDSNPHWVQALMFVASPVLALFGGHLMRRQRQRRIQSA